MTENELKAQIALWQNRALGAQALVYEAAALLEAVSPEGGNDINGMNWYDARHAFIEKVKA